jgi:hypothetical protein
MKKIHFFMSLGLILGTLFCSLEGASAGQNQAKTSVGSPTKKADNSSVQEKFDLMERDENSDTDALAIPFDDSEVEDEEQIDLDEKEDLFSLPHSR